MTQKTRARKFFKNEAKKIIFSEWLTFIGATLIIVLILTGKSAIQGSYLYLLSGRMPQYVFSALSLFLNLLSVILFLPISFGYLSWCVDKYEGETSEISSIFKPFSSKIDLIRSYKISLYIIFRGVLIFLIPILLHMFLRTSFFEQKMISFIEVYSNLSEIILFFLYLTVLLLYYFSFTSTTTLFLTGYICIKQPKSNVHMCFNKASKLMKGYKTQALIMQFSFVGWILLSLFTAGVVFIVFVIPYIFMTTISFCSYIFAENEINLKNIEQTSLEKTIIKD